MKITVTWKAVEQIGDEWATYTEVVHCENNETLKSLYERLTERWRCKNLDCELHFNVDEEVK